MSETNNNFSLPGDKYMPEMHLRQPGFTYRACGPFTENEKRIKNFKIVIQHLFLKKNQINLFST